MRLEKFMNCIPKNVYSILTERFNVLRPCQAEAIKKGLFKRKNILVCTPTASGKTLVGEMAVLNTVLNHGGKAVYVVPLKALASEKHKEFSKRYDFKIGLSSGDIDSSDAFLNYCSLIITTSEKLDSLIRHNAPWIKNVKLLIIDEVHLLNDASRGPTLEVIITILRKMLKDLQVICLSATIGNPKELAAWLDAELINDSWRPVRLDQGVYLNGEIEFFS